MFLTLRGGASPPLPSPLPMCAAVPYLDLDLELDLTFFAANLAADSLVDLSLDL